MITQQLASKTTTKTTTSKRFSTSTSSSLPNTNNFNRNPYGRSVTSMTNNNNFPPSFSNIIPKNPFMNASTPMANSIYLHVESNEYPALALYLKNGFKEMGRIPSNDNFVLFMRKIID